MRCWKKWRRGRAGCRSRRIRSCSSTRPMVNIRRAGEEPGSIRSMRIGLEGNRRPYWNLGTSANESAQSCLQVLRDIRKRG